MAKLRLESVLAVVGLSLAVVLAGPKSSAGTDQVGAQAPPQCNVYGAYYTTCPSASGGTCRMTYGKCQSSVPGSNTMFCLPNQGPIACSGQPLSCTQSNADFITQNCTP